MTEPRIEDLEAHEDGQLTPPAPPPSTNPFAERLQPIDSDLANQRYSRSTPVTTKISQSGTFDDQRRSMPAMKPPIVSPKRSRGMSLRSQLLNKTVENHLKAYRAEDETYTENIEMQPVSKASTNTLVGARKKGDIESIAHSMAPSISAGSTPPKTYSIARMIAHIKFALGLTQLRPSRAGRKIPLSAGSFDMRTFSRANPLFADAFDAKDGILLDERTGRPYISNQIVSLRYNVINFLPKQLYAQFLKLANIYFMTIAIMQLVPNWSTTGTSTTIIPLSFFISVLIAREGIDDLRRHAQDKQENNKQACVLAKDHDEAQKQLPERRSSRNSVISKLSDALDTSATELNVDFSGASEEDVYPDEAGLFASRSALNRAGIVEKKVLWKDLKVGDIIRLGQDSAVPCDIILLALNNNNNEVFVETMDLDGETNLKTKLPHAELQRACSTASGLSRVQGMITSEDPNQSLYTYEGHVVLNDKKYPLTNDNIVYRGLVVRNTNCVIGIVVFSGEESKIRMNAIRNPRTKAPHLQRSINIIIIFMICVVVGLSVGLFIAQRKIYDRVKNKYSYIRGKDAGLMPTFMSFIIMYNTLIPLSLYVTMELIKVAQLLFLQYDLDLYHQPTNTPAEAKTATILEELGQVSYVFSDKTGTLTDNLMIFKKFSVGGVSWEHDLETVLETLPPEVRSPISPILPRKSSDMLLHKDSMSRGSLDTRRGTGTAHFSGGLPSMAAINVAEYTRTISKKGHRLLIELVHYIQTHPHRRYAQKAKFFILSLALCHTCFPKRVGEDVEYQSSLPDELALVAAARDMGFVVYDKRQNALILKTFPDGMDKPAVEEVYLILDVLEFSLARKRMLCVVQFPNGRKCLLCKGADNVILARLKASYDGAAALEKIAKAARERKQQEADYVINERHLTSVDLFDPVATIRRLMTLKRNEIGPEKIEDMLGEKERVLEDMERIAQTLRKLLHLDQQRRYGVTNTEALDDNLAANDQYVAEKTMEHVDAFSTEGLRTLLYGYRWLLESEYSAFSREYSEAKTALVDRQARMEAVGESLESELDLCGATAIEDKLQEGVPDAISKLHEAGIRMWMLTGDKRETAINIGYLCGLIKNVLTLVILSLEEDDDPGLVAKMEAALLEIRSQNVAHCVVVVDGQTLSGIESDVTMMDMFTELGCVADAVVCCRASPAQKAKLVEVVKHKFPRQVTLAIGDGANDIAMIQSADIGVGITGKEGLQAARSLDYLIAQFRYLVKLLLVHGRYNYVRTTKFVIFTFYKEFMFYLLQAVFQSQTLFTGTLLYEPWSLLMFNTLFTSLPVLCVGIVEKDLRPATLIANPQLYRQGRENRSFNVPIFLYNMMLATGTSVMVTMLLWKLWGYTSLRDNTLMPNGVLTYIVFVVLINVKCQMLDMRNRNLFAFALVIIETVAVFIWNFFITVLYKDDTLLIYYVQQGMTLEFGTDITWWAALVLLLILALLVDIVLRVLQNWFIPSAVDYFQEFEKNFILRSWFEQEAYPYLHQLWEFPRDKNFQKIRRFTRKKDTDTDVDHTMDLGIDSTLGSFFEHNGSITEGVVDQNDPNYTIHVLPSGKIHRRRIEDSRLTRIGKKMGFIVDDRRLQDMNSIQEVDGEDEDEFIGSVMKHRQPELSGLS